MTIQEIRKLTHMTQRQFSTFFGIPLGTLRNWEQGIANPPEYVFHMIAATIGRDKMINIETVKFIRMLDQLAALSENGIEEFANATESNAHSKVFYDRTNVNEDGSYKVVLDSCVIDDPSCLHHDVICYYDSYVNDYDTSEYSVGVVIDEDDSPCISVRMALSNNEIVIHDGIWYFA